MAEREQPFPTGRWPGGMNNRTDIEGLGIEFLRRALNVDLDATGKPYLRPGQELLQAGYAHSAYSEIDWPCGFCVLTGQLLRLTELAGVLATDVLGSYDARRPLSYARMNEHVYFSNGLVTGRVPLDGGAVEPWGVEDPDGQPTLALSATGGMDAGRYQVAVVFVARSGEESGSEQAVAIDVPTGGGIMLTNIPQPEDSTVSIRVYASPANGDALYSAATFPAGTTAYLLGRTVYGKLIETHLMQRVPPCTIVRAHKGQLYFVVGKFLYHTDALRFGLYRVQGNYYRFPDDITMVQPVEDGLYVGSETRTMFLPSAGTKDVKSKVIDYSGVVAGTGMTIRKSALGDSNSDDLVATWWSKKSGLIIGNPGGTVISATDKKLSLPIYQSGATLFRERKGMRHILSVLSEPQGQAFGAGDKVVTEIWRNGVLLE